MSTAEPDRCPHFNDLTQNRINVTIYVRLCRAYYSQTTPTSDNNLMKVYMYAMPFIFIIGVCGNILSLRVFLSKKMRPLSATVYLAALSISDLIVLFTFGALNWLDTFLPEIVESDWAQLLTYPGVCQLYEYVVHVARLVSAWCIVVFTIGMLILLYYL